MAASRRPEAHRLALAACAIALREHGWRVVSKQSFPFPRPVGRVFPYNEFVVVGERDPDA